MAVLKIYNKDTGKFISAVGAKGEKGDSASVVVSATQPSDPSSAQMWLDTSANFESGTLAKKEELESAVSTINTKIGTLAEKEDLESAVSALESTISTTAAKYLPLSGGTLTGSVVLSGGPIVYAKSSSEVVGIYGGGYTSVGNYCAGFWAHGITDEYAGYARVRAGTSSSNWKDLVLKPSGEMTWNGREVLRDSGSSVSAGTGYTTLSNGLILQWGQSSVATGGTITLPKAFSGATYRVVAQHYGSEKSINVVSNLVSSSVFRIYHTYSSAVQIQWIAIGA